MEGRKPDEDGTCKRRSPAAALLLALIRFYQFTLSALLGRRCRHLPTCSEYSHEAISRYGAWRGGWLGLSRILRCNPWGTEGFDPVPLKLPDHGLRFWRYGCWRGKGTSQNE